MTSTETKTNRDDRTPASDAGLRRPSDASRAAALAYIEGAAGSGSTARWNEEAWSRWALRPRMFRDVSELDTSTTLLGHELGVPLFVAPWARHGIADADAEKATARAARATGVGFALSSSSSLSVEQIGPVAGPYLQQLYLFKDRELVKPFLERAVRAGAFGIALTVDAPSQGVPHAFRSAMTATDLSGAEGWTANFQGLHESSIGATPDVSLDDISWIAEFTGLPVLVKGILRADDALSAVDAGAAGVIVSNHGGRQLDATVPTADVLPEIVKAIGHDAVVLVDGGIRSGEDVLRALALGASAVLVGRPAARALVHGGEAGVAAELSRFVQEFERALVLAGAPTVASISRDLVRYRT